MGSGVFERRRRLGMVEGLYFLLTYEFRIQWTIDVPDFLVHQVLRNPMNFILEIFSFPRFKFHGVATGDFSNLE